VIFDKMETSHHSWNKKNFMQMDQNRHWGSAPLRSLSTFLEAHLTYTFKQQGLNSGFWWSICSGQYG
jgi:hypothetical protein